MTTVQLVACQTADPGVGSSNFSSATLLQWKLIIKSFLRSFSPVLLIQEGQFSVTGKSICSSTG